METGGSRCGSAGLGAFAAFAQRKTYICQAELLAYLCAYLTFPDLLEGHLIHHFGDNMAAISGVVKGGSSLPDSARLIHAIHLQVLRLRCYPWFGFVYSEDNVADLPSRLDFVLMRRIGAVERRCVFPTELDWASPARFLTGLTLREGSEGIKEPLCTLGILAAAK